MVPGTCIQQIEKIATEALALLGSGRQVTPFSLRYPNFDLEEAYEVTIRVCAWRRLRGENPIGRKIGFTNRAAWPGHDISGPIWNYIYDSTVHDLAAVGRDFALAGLAEPRIEPEIALHLARAPDVGMNEEELLSCIDWIGHGFEIVHSIFPGWRFTAADAVAACAAHGAYLLGERHEISGDRSSWGEALSNFSVKLTGDNGVDRLGHAQNVLGGPLKALRFLVEELARHPACEALRAGELVTTGTLTEAMPIVVGQTWCTALSGIEVQGLRVRFR